MTVLFVLPEGFQNVVNDCDLFDLPLKGTNSHSLSTDSSKEARSDSDRVLSLLRGKTCSQMFLFKL